MFLGTDVVDRSELNRRPRQWGFNLPNVGRIRRILWRICAPRVLGDLPKGEAGLPRHVVGHVVWTGTMPLVVPCGTINNGIKEVS